MLAPRSTVELVSAAMLSVAANFLLLMHLAPNTLAQPIDRQHVLAGLPVQQVSPTNARKHSSHLDAAANSVGLLFTTADEEDVGHVWLPLGRRVYTR